jgi:DNA (cytosine-5)-methyltransferase 1
MHRCQTTARDSDTSTCSLAFIGGFALAAQEVWKDDYETAAFCDTDRFCQAVLKKHWPHVQVYGDIRELNRIVADSDIGTSRPRNKSEPIGTAQLQFSTDCRTIADSEHDGRTRTEAIGEHNEAQLQEPSGKELHGDEPEGTRELRPDETRWDSVDLLTGGFPCQPFSAAGKRRGTGDERHLWPEMLTTIRLVRPRWVLAENVRGLLNIESGMVFEQVCTDLEDAGYQVWPFLIPACGVGAPHRRDRIWIVAHSESFGSGGRPEEIRETDGRQKRRLYTESNNADSDAPDDVRNAEGTGQPSCELGQGEKQYGGAGARVSEDARNGWSENLSEVATRLCGVDDGVPARMDGLELSAPQHRIERLKALGNSIVPAVAVELFKAMKETDGMTEALERDADAPPEVG